mmetsp:Transcript_17157/g.40990  ORF Transcript_17157/g.40990 Transcript_17157/m.40990 type:complete len:361 (+) Transcript_17157:160-1242(+)
MPPTPPTVPSLSQLPASNAAPLGPPTPHAKSGRRLSKAVVRADSHDSEGSKVWGMVAVRDHTGEEKQVRVVQNVEIEDLNMVRVSWFWTWRDKCHQVELRHGRRTGIRKIYVDKEIVERVKSVKNLLVSTDSSHVFDVGGKTAEIAITARGASGFTYQLIIDGCPIEQRINGPTSDAPLDIGTRAVVLPKSEGGLGMTLRNNPLQLPSNRHGVVVWTVEQGKAAEKAGIQVGDVVLSVSNYLVDSIDNLVMYVSECERVVHMELAGTAPSRIVSLVKHRDNPKVGLSLQTTSCGIGILITDIEQDSLAAQSHLTAGDTILSIDDNVPTSPKHASQLIANGKYAVKFVVIGHAQPLSDFAT